MGSRKKLLNSNVSPTFPHNMVNFGVLAADIGWRVWGTPANFNGFRVLASLLHSTLVVGVSQTLRSWTEGATYTRQGGHHIGHWPTFLVFCSLMVVTVCIVSLYRMQLSCPWFHSVCAYHRSKIWWSVNGDWSCDTCRKPKLYTRTGMAFGQQGPSPAQVAAFGSESYCQLIWCYCWTG